MCDYCYDDPSYSIDMIYGDTKVVESRFEKQGPESPYLVHVQTLEVRSMKYNPEFGDNRKCLCGHPYHRHFDPYEHGIYCGCKYCECSTFQEDLG